MQKLIWIGQPYFYESLKECGFEQTFIHDFSGNRVFGWEDIVNLAGFVPDVVVVADKSLPPFVLGVENFPCLTVFYAIDSHIHSWQPLYAQAFDACLVSLKDHIPKFAGPFLKLERVWWSPPFAKNDDQPDKGAEKIYDCLFVGTNNSGLMPGRYAFLKELQGKIPELFITSGDYKKLYPKGKTLINHAERGDLNFRVFEAMGCGGCLVTPRVGHGLAELFIDGEHLVGYAPGDAGDAAYRIHFLLDHPDVANHVGEMALKAINEGHRAIHRAQAFSDHLCDLFIAGADNIIKSRLAQGDKIRKAALGLPYLLWGQEMEDPKLKKAYLAASRGEFQKA